MRQGNLCPVMTPSRIFALSQHRPQGRTSQEDELDLSFIKVGRSSLTVSSWSAQRGQWETTLCFSPALPTITSSILLRLSGSGNVEVRAGRDCCPSFLHFTEKKPRPREGACSGRTAGSLQWILSEVCVFPSCWNITITWAAENNKCLFSCSSGG